MPSSETDYLAETSTPETVAQEVRSDLIVAPERRNTVIRLRRMGLSYEQISEAISQDPETNFEVSRTGARRIVHAYLEQMAAEDRESLDQLRELENMRLDDMQKALAQKVSTGSIPAIKAALKIMERRAKLNGLDAPEVKGILGAFAHVGDAADPQVVEEHLTAFVSAFQRPGIPAAVEGNGRQRD